LKNFEIEDVESKGYSFFMETVFQIHKSGNFIKEVPIVFSDRKKGVSKIPKIETFRTLKNLILLKIK
jgi:dolichol-phosphate mannosyltransferase